MARVDLTINGKDKGASAAIKGVTGSIFKAQIAMEGLKLAVGLFVKGFQKVQESIDLASDFQETSSKFETVFKDVSDESKKMATNLQKNFGLSAKSSMQLLSDTGDMLTGFGFAGDSALDLSNKVQELAVDLASFTNFSGGAEGASQALTKGLLGEREMMKSLGIAINETDLQQELISQGKDKLTGMALRQAKAEATLTLAYQQSKNAIGDYAKTADSYANVGRRLQAVQDNIKVTIASELLPAFNEVRLTMLKSAEGFKEYVSSAEVLEKLQDITRNLMAGFSVLKKIVKDLAEKGLKIIKDIANDVKESWDNLMDSFEDGNAEFSLLDVMLRTLGASMTIIGKAIKVVIVGFIDLVTVANEASQVLGDVWQVLRGKKQWKDVKGNIDDFGDAIGNMAINAKDNIGDLVSTTIKEFDNLTDSTKSQSSKWANIFDDSYTEILKRQEEFNKKQKEKNKDKNEELEKDNKDSGKKWAEAFSDASSQVTGVATNTSNSTVDIMGKMFNELQNGFVELGKIMTDETASAGQKVLATLKGLVEASSAIMSGVQEMMNEHYAQQIEAQTIYQEEQLASTDEWMAAEMERQGVRMATKQEQLNQEITDLDSKLKTETDAEKKADLQKQIQAKKDELARQKILDEGEKRKAKIREDAKKKETALKKKQFEENKMWSIAQVWINAASSVMGWWSSFASMGIPGIVLAAVMTATTLAMAGAQTGLIASQTFHGQEGGEVPVGTLSGDRAVTFMNKGEALLQNQDYKDLVSMARGEGGAGGDTFVIEYMEVIANTPEQLADQLIEVRRQERSR